MRIRDRLNALTGRPAVSPDMRRFLERALIVREDLREVDANVATLYNASTSGDREGTYEALMRLGPSAERAHEAIEPMVSEMVEIAGSRTRQIDALALISAGALEWRRTQLSVEADRESLGDTREFVDQFDVKVFNAYKQWRGAEDTLHDAGGLEASTRPPSHHNR